MNSGQPAAIVGSIEEDISGALSTLAKVRKPEKVFETADASKKDELQHKMAALQHEERALLSLLTHLRSHQRTLQLEQIRLNQLYEEKIKNEKMAER